MRSQLSPYDSIDKAYKLGKNAGKSGKDKLSNPYPKPEKNKNSVSAKEYLHWNRGWLAGSWDKH